MVKDIVIYGYGGAGRGFHQIVEDINEDSHTWNFIGFIDDNSSPGETVHGYPVVGGASWLEQHNSVYVAVAMGSSAEIGRAHV